MERMGTKIYLYGRYALLFLLMGSLSPAPSVVSARPSELVMKLAALSGDLRIVIQKSRNVLTVYKGMTPVRSYWAALGKGNHQGDKHRTGDKRTPEGHFYICSMNNSERFYKFMGISYPSIQHAEKGMLRGLITYGQYREIWKAISELRQPPWDTALGGAIGIHGRLLDNAVQRIPNPVNWTDGCIALNNEDVDELFSVAVIGTPVAIIP